MATILELKNIVKVFEDNVVVDNVSLEIKKGEFFTLLGPSGCGKTTLLRIIAGFMLPDSGQVLLSGKNITSLAPEDRPLHTIFQSYALFPHMTVFDNIAFPLRMAKWHDEKIISQVTQLLEDVRLTKYAKRYPHELSGGQSQRVAIARSLADRPQVLLLDEPLSALDERLKKDMHVELGKIQEESGVTFVYVTHDQNEALALSSRMAVMNLGQIEQLGAPQTVYSKPSTYFVADFLGKCNLFKAVVQAIEPTIKQISLLVADILEFNLIVPDITDIEVGTEGFYAIRPEKLKAKRTDTDDDALYSVPATVNNYYYYGDGTLYFLTLANNVKVQCMLANTRTEQATFFSDESAVMIFFDPQAGSFLLH